MTLPRNFAPFFAFVLFAGAARAQAPEPTGTPAPVAYEMHEEPRANIRQGNMKVSGGFLFDKSSYAGAKSSYDIDAVLQYFVIDRLALGGAFSVTNGNSQRNVVSLLGVRGTYYFWAQDQMGAYVSLRSNLGLTDHTVTGQHGASVGFDFFATPSVSFGPALNTWYVIERDGGTNYWYNSVSAYFGIFL